jgi:hypothetical protein
LQNLQAAFVTAFPSNQGWNPYSATGDGNDPVAPLFLGLKQSLVSPLEEEAGKGTGK